MLTWSIEMLLGKKQRNVEQHKATKTRKLTCVAFILIIVLGKYS